MSDGILIALCTADLNLTIKRRGNGLCEIRHWYAENEYTTEFQGDWDACIAYLQQAWNEFKLRLLDC